MQFVLNYKLFVAGNRNLTRYLTETTPHLSNLHFFTDDS